MKERKIRSQEPILRPAAVHRKNGLARKRRIAAPGEKRRRESIVGVRRQDAALDLLVRIWFGSSTVAHENPKRRLAVAQANVESSVKQIKGVRPILPERIKAGKLRVVGTVDELKTGKVKFLA